VRTCTALFPQCVLCSKLCSIDYVANYVANNVAILGCDYVANDYVANCVANLLLGLGVEKRSSSSHINVADPK
jgi:hypothetical protein